jgi:serine/threonine-protein kinase
MKPERWQQVDKILETALEREPGERSAFLKEACAGDESLRMEVESLLAADEQAENLIEAPAVEMVAEGFAKNQVGSLAGQEIGSYKILSLLGAGGMGEVYLAQDGKLDRKVALKFLPEELQQDSTAKKRFLREAKSAAALDHPYICHIHEVGEAEGRSFISMEYVQGVTLEEKLAQGPLPLKDALEKATEVAEALEEAHKQGIVHRDLKPSNIMLTPQGHVKVMDFGLAKQVTPVEGQGEEITTKLTQQGSTLGTVPYMSPEQVRGQVVDTRSDIFSFGVVLYEMLSGVNPFKKGSTMDTAHAILSETPPPLTRYTEAIPVLLQHTVKKMLAKEPDQRYQLIHEVRTDLGELLEESRDSISQVVSSPSGMGVAPAVPRQMLPWVAASILLTALVVGVAVWNLNPLPASGPVSRFFHVLPDDQSLTGVGRSVVAVSPEGTQVVYVANEQLYLRNLNQLAAMPVGGTNEDPRQPFFSPDGEWIGYRSAAENQLKKIPVSGGTPVALAASSNFLGTPSWGTDGSILYATGSGVMRVSENGGTPEVIVATSDSERALGPRMLPGGEWVIFALGSRESGQIQEERIVAQSLETGERKVLREDGSAVRYVPTGHLVYAFQGVLLAIPFDTDDMEITGGPVAIIEGVQQNPFNSANYDVSDNGTLVYLQGASLVGSHEGILALADRNGDRQPLDVRTAQYTGPRLSPDGTHLTVETRDDSEQSTVWVYDLSGDTQMRRLAQQGNNISPIWTPDGQRITFASDRDGSWGIYSQLADGRDVAELLMSETQSKAKVWVDSWSPDGRTLSFVRSSVSGDDGVWTLSLDREGEPELFYDVTDGSDQLGSSFSPDGSWIAFHSDLGGETGGQIYVLPFPATGVKPLQITQEGGVQPLWSRDGSELFYRSPLPNRPAIVGALIGVDVRTEAAFEWGAEQPLPIAKFWAVEDHRDYDITPDGKRFMVIIPSTPVDSSESTRPQINIVLNWFEELKRMVPTN